MLARLGDLSFLADHPAQSLQFEREAMIQFDHVVECIRDFAIHPFQIDRQAHRKVAPLECIQRGQQRLLIQLALVPLRRPQ